APRSAPIGRRDTGAPMEAPIAGTPATGVLASDFMAALTTDSVTSAPDLSAAFGPAAASATTPPCGPSTGTSTTPTTIRRSSTTTTTILASATTEGTAAS